MKRGKVFVLLVFSILLVGGVSALTFKNGDIVTLKHVGTDPNPDRYLSVHVASHGSTDGYTLVYADKPNVGGETERFILSLRRDGTVGDPISSGDEVNLISLVTGSGMKSDKRSALSDKVITSNKWGTLSDLNSLENWNEFSPNIVKYSGSEQINCGDEVYFKEDGKGKGFLDINEGSSDKHANLGSKNKFVIYDATGDCVTPSDSSSDLCSAESQVILKLSGKTNAHAALATEPVSKTEYPVEICYDKFFNKQGTRGSGTSCKATTLTLSDVSNAQGAILSYPNSVCYGDLDCQWKTRGLQTCDSGYTEIASLQDATNSQLGIRGAYENMLCCKSPSATPLPPPAPCVDSCNKDAGDTPAFCLGLDLYAEKCLIQSNGCYANEIQLISNNYCIENCNTPTDEDRDGLNNCEDTDCNGLHSNDCGPEEVCDSDTQACVSCPSGTNFDSTTGTCVSGGSCGDGTCDVDLGECSSCPADCPSGSAVCQTSGEPEAKWQKKVDGVLTDTDKFDNGPDGDVIYMSGSNLGVASGEIRIYKKEPLLIPDKQILGSGSGITWNPTILAILPFSLTGNAIGSAKITGMPVASETDQTIDAEIDQNGNFKIGWPITIDDIERAGGTSGSTTKGFYFEVIDDSGDEVIQSGDVDITFKEKISCADNKDSVSCSACTANSDATINSASALVETDFPGKKCGDQVYPDSNLDCPSIIECICSWGNDLCGGDYKLVPVEGCSNIGGVDNFLPPNGDIICNHLPTTSGTCADSDWITYSWTGTFGGWTAENQYTADQVDLIVAEYGEEIRKNFVLDGGFWRYNPITDGMNETDRCEMPRENSIPCPSSLKVPFFGFYQVIATLSLIFGIYTYLVFKKRE